MQIGCIQVLYKPNLVILRQSINSIIKQVQALVIIDNSPSQTDISFIANNSKVIYIFNNKNVGIAEAQNIGIKELTLKGIDYIYFSDQDSIPPLDTIEVLVNELKKLIQQNINVGAIGPTIINRQTNMPYKARIKKGRKISSTITEVSELISSGSLISTNMLKKVGGMDSNLFIDGVDHEWCWRAKMHEQCRFFITRQVQLSHQLGEGDHHFFGINIAISTPFRDYYQFRNYFILSKRSYVPTYWKIINGIKYFIRLIYYPLFVSPRWSHLKMMHKGLKDGIYFILTNKYKQ